MEGLALRLPRHESEELSRCLSRSLHGLSCGAKEPQISHNLSSYLYCRMKCDSLYTRSVLFTPTNKTRSLYAAIQTFTYSPILGNKYGSFTADAEVVLANVRLDATNSLVGVYESAVR